MIDKKIATYIANSLFSSDNDSNKATWHVLSALRGPDQITRFEVPMDAQTQKITNRSHYSVDDVKHATTAVLRFALFSYNAANRNRFKKILPNPIGEFGAFGATYAVDEEESAKLRQLLSLYRHSNVYGLPSEHFISHAMNAFAALGLDWFSVNTFPLKQPAVDSDSITQGTSQA